MFKIALSEEYNTAPPRSPRLNFESLKMLPTSRPSSSQYDYNIQHSELQRQNVHPHQRSSHLGKSRMSRSHGDHPLHLDRGKIASSISLPELSHAHESDHTNKKLSQETKICSKKPATNLFANSASVPLGRLNVEQDDNAQRITRKRCASEMHVSLHSKNESINEFSEYEECRSMGRKTDDSTPIPVLDLTPDDVVAKIGHRLFWKARNTILRQQRAFALQKFELHRLIKVQRIIAGSPEVLHGNNFNLKNPPKYKDCARDLKDAEKESSTPKSPNNPKIAPWCFHPTGNQWPVPVKSASEGLIYEPFLGPFIPPLGIMAPFVGNYWPINFGVTNYGQSYWQPYTIPMPMQQINQFYCGGNEAQGINGIID